MERMDRRKLPGAGYNQQYEIFGSNKKSIWKLLIKNYDN